MYDQRRGPHFLSNAAPDAEVHGGFLDILDSFQQARDGQETLADTVKELTGKHLPSLPLDERHRNIPLLSLSKLLHLEYCDLELSGSLKLGHQASLRLPWTLDEGTTTMQATAPPGGSS